MSLPFAVLDHRRQFELGDVLLTRRAVYSPSVRSESAIGVAWPVVVLTGTEGAIDTEFLDIRVAPIALDCSQAAEWDLLCGPTDGPLGTPFIVELWNARPMLVKNVDRYIGRLSEQAIVHLCQLNNAMFGIDPLPRTFVAHGSPITDNRDARLAYQHTRAEAAALLSSPVDDLLRMHAEGSPRR